MKIFLILMLLVMGLKVFAQDQNKDGTSIEAAVQKVLASKWYEKLQIKGYSQFRYNRFLESNRDLKCSQCDKSLGDKQGFFLRRGRFVFFGEMSDRLYIYIQPDIAQATSDEKQNFFQLRDAYFDYALVPDKTLRIRTGIAKVPYGFDNLQSSSNRAAFDRSDALNSGTPNERDNGIFLMWETVEGKKLLKEMTQNNLKGSGDYGMVTVGFYNGQTLNMPEKNNGLHTVARLNLPMKTANGQMMEAAVSGYAGRYVLTTSGEEFLDQRTNASFVYYPQPLGFQAEYTEGIGPEYDRDDNVVQRKKLSGGYAQVMYQANCKNTRIFPYVRYQTYAGGKKLEDARSYKVNEWELGTEFSPDPSLELTIAVMKSDRLAQDSSNQNNHQNGHTLRLQAQINY